MENKCGQQLSKGNKKAEVSVKILVVGPSGVGKSSIIAAYKNKDKPLSNIGISPTVGKNAKY